MSDGAVPPIVRRVAWEGVGLVEGTESVLWPARSEDDVSDGRLPPASEGSPAVLSMVRATELRFETASTQPFPDLLLVSTLAVGGPAHFVVRKSHQVGAAVACDPPSDVYLVERREQFRVTVAAPLFMLVGPNNFSAHTLDCSAAGVRSYLPLPVEVGDEALLDLDLGEGERLRLIAAARHCFRFDEATWVAGFEFTSVPPSGRRQISHFLALQERRLIPRVRALTLVEYRSDGQEGFYGALASELSPGDVTVALYEARPPGNGVELRVRLHRQDFVFTGRVVACNPVVEAGQMTVRYNLRVCLDAAPGAVEDQWRKALRQLALQKQASWES